VDAAYIKPPGKFEFNSALNAGTFSSANPAQKRMA